MILSGIRATDADLGNATFPYGAAPSPVCDGAPSLPRAATLSFVRIATPSIPCMGALSSSSVHRSSRRREELGNGA